MPEPTDPQAQAAFANMIVSPESALPAAIEWMRDNLSPGDVFDDEQLMAWAKVRGFNLNT